MSTYLPTELLDKIFSFVDDNDIKTFYSCILVNRVWCKTMIPHLWKHSFRLANVHQREILIPAYFPFFSEETRNVLQLDISSTQMTFDYPSFLRELDFNDLYLLIRKWCKLSNSATSNKFIRFEVFKQRGRKSLILLQELSKLLMSKCNRLDYLSLDIKKIRFDHYYGILAECMTVASSHSLSSLKTFVSRWLYCKDAVFKPMIQYCKNIDEIIIIDDEDSSEGESESLINLITIQRKLEKFTIGNWWKYLSKILNSLGSQCNNLIYVKIYGCHFSNDFDDSSTFNGLISCKNLETLKIEKCYNLTSNIMKPLASTTFPKLHTLYFSNYLLIDEGNGDQGINQGTISSNNNQDLNHPYLELIAIVQNSSITLRNLGLNMDLFDYPNIISTCATYCPNITSYKARIQNHSEMNQLLQLLKSCTQLEQLEITAEKWDCSDYGLPWEIDLFFPEIGKLLPKTLKYFDIDGWSCTPLGLSNFLKNCNVDIKRMSWMCYISSADYLDVIQKYAILKGRKVNGHREKKGWGLNLTLIVDFD